MTSHEHDDDDARAGRAEDQRDGGTGPTVAAEGTAPADPAPATPPPATAADEPAVEEPAVEEPSPEPAAGPEPATGHEPGDDAVAYPVSPAETSGEAPLTGA
ncbi:MAG TPA: hypothetical protein VHG90_12210, partial [Acidimicrobiales bacterium]|nr:hypothetical protein [Acidimicrobiales bacterium]